MGVFALMIFTAAIDQPGPRPAGFGQRQPVLQSREKVRIHRLAGFDLDRDELGGVFEQQIHFVAGPVAPEIKVGGQTVIEPGFERFTHHPVLEQRTPLRMGVELSGLPDGQQPDRQSRVVKIQLGRFDQPFVEIAVVGLQLKYTA